MKVINSLFLFAPCLSALVISCCEYFLISVKLKDSCVFCLVFSCCLRKIRQFLYFQTSPNLRRMFYFVRIRQRPFSRLTGQRRAAPIPWTQPWGRCSLYKHSARSIVGGAACISAAPAPLFAAQPTKVFRRGLFQKGRKVFWHTFFQKRYEVFC